MKKIRKLKKKKKNRKVNYILITQTDFVTVYANVEIHGITSLHFFC